MPNAIGEPIRQLSVHRLAPLFEARSVAVVGASAREGSFGLRLAEAVLSGGYNGCITFVNPRGGEILGRPCHTHIAELDEAPDIAILGVGAANIERSLIEAIDLGARSAVIFDGCFGTSSQGTPLLDRLRDIAREANLPVCGGNGMGLISVPNGCVASFYPTTHLKPGGISLIAHSGSVFTTLSMNDTRYRFDFIVSSGQEIGATVDEYIDYAIDRPTTNVVAVFMEAARNPDGFVRSLKRARDHGMPVIVCKVGRSEESALVARSHCGALAGSRDAYDAVLRDCGAIAVDTVDQLMNAAQLCSTGRVPGPGGAGLVTDSGGLRELVMDRAAEIGAPLANLSDQTIEKLREGIPPTLPLSNPMDCAGDLNDEFADPFDHSLETFAGAEEVSMLGYEVDLRDDYVYHQRLKQFARDLASRTDKPCFFYSSFARAHIRKTGDELADYGVPCINGTDEMLFAVKNLQGWADRRARSSDADELRAPVEPDMVGRWQEFLSSEQGMDEVASLSLLSDFGVPVVRGAVCEDWDVLRNVADDIGYPLVLKTAEIGIDHKSDLGGVVLNLTGESALRAAYEGLASRLGPRVTVQAMAGKGVELAMGCVVDPDFGPLVMVSAGGTLIELFTDRRFALAPFGPKKARRLIDNLAVSALLDGVRGAPPADRQAAAEAVSAFSQLCATLRSEVAEIDVNPLVVTEKGALAVDALVVPSGGPS